MSGWICLHRKLLDWEWYSDSNTMRLFVHCLLKANYEEKTWRGVKLKRGQFITSRDSLSKELGLSVMQIRTAINKLKSTNDITIKTSTKNTIITVSNYELYQDNNQQINHNNNQQNNQQHNRQITTDNNITINKETNKREPDSSNQGELDFKIPVTPPVKPAAKNYSDQFEQFWQQAIIEYKRCGDAPGNKAEAYEQWKKLKPTEDEANLWSSAIRSQATIRKKTRDVGGRIASFKNLSRWLKNSCWEDVIAPWADTGNISFLKKPQEPRSTLGMMP